MELGEWFVVTVDARPLRGGAQVRIVECGSTSSVLLVGHPLLAFIIGELSLLVD